MSNIKSNPEIQEVIDHIATYLRIHRSQQYTQSELSEIAGVHRNSISRLETGNGVTLKTLLEISFALDLPLRELFWDM